MTATYVMNDECKTTKKGLSSKQFWTFYQEAGLRFLCADPARAFGDEFKAFYDPSMIDTRLSQLKGKELAIYCTERRSPNTSWCLTARGPAEAIFGRRGRPVLQVRDRMIILTGASRHDGEVYLTLEKMSGVVQSTTAVHLADLGAKYVGIAARNDRGRYSIFLLRD